jgi:hypothetical protein
VADRLQWALHGSEQPRLRATWRVLLAVSLLPLVGLVLALMMGVMGLAGMIVGEPLQAAILLIVLAGWAWAIDRRPLTDYGLSLSRSWLGDLLAGAGAVVVGHLVWYSFGLAGGCDCRQWSWLRRGRSGRRPDYRARDTALRTRPRTARRCRCVRSCRSTPRTSYRVMGCNSHIFDRSRPPNGGVNRVGL